MTFKHNKILSTEHTGIKGTALITATDIYDSVTYGYLVDVFRAVSDVNKVSQIKSKFKIRDITGNFDAFEHDGNLGRTSNTGSNDTYKILPNKKVLVMARLAGDGTHSSTTNIGCQLVTYSTTSTDYSVSTSYINTSSLNQYYALGWNTYTPNNYSTSLQKNPGQLNSSDIGKYFRRANINSLDPEIMYAYIETPSSGDFHLGVYIYSGSASWDTYDKEKEMHFIQLIQFE